MKEGCRIVDRPVYPLPELTPQSLTRASFLSIVTAFLSADSCGAPAAPVNYSNYTCLLLSSSSLLLLFSCLLICKSNSLVTFFLKRRAQSGNGKKNKRKEDQNGPFSKQQNPRNKEPFKQSQVPSLWQPSHSPAI